MKALYKYAPGARAARLEEHPAPQLTPRDNVFIRVSVCAVSAADLQIYQGKFSSTPPFIMGHEFVGEVESVFPGVTAVAPDGASLPLRLRQVPKLPGRLPPVL